MSAIELPRIADATLWLRTPQANYLRRFADTEGVTFSRALAMIIAEYAEQSFDLQTNRPVQKVRQHFFLTEDHLATLDRLTVDFGLSRSEVARRLIDRARGARILEMC